MNNTIFTGFYHSLGLTRDGRVVGRGRNNVGQIDCPSGNNFVAIAAGRYHSLALTRDGHVIGWGKNNFGKINCPSGNHFVAIAAGSHHSLALTRDGRVVGWGNDIKIWEEKFALSYDFVTRLNFGLKILCNLPKYIKMEVLEDYTEWEFRDLYYLE